MSPLSAFPRSLGLGPSPRSPRSPPLGPPRSLGPSPSVPRSRSLCPLGPSVSVPLGPLGPCHLGPPYPPVVKSEAEISEGLHDVTKKLIRHLEFSWSF